eukprot:tig00020528_g9996.t1
MPKASSRGNAPGQRQNRCAGSTDAQVARKKPRRNARDEDEDDEEAGQTRRKKLKPTTYAHIEWLKAGGDTEGVFSGKTHDAHAKAARAETASEVFDKNPQDETLTQFRKHSIAALEEKLHAIESAGNTGRIGASAVAAA